MVAAVECYDEAVVQSGTWSGLLENLVILREILWSSRHADKLRALSHARANQTSGTKLGANITLFTSRDA